MGRLTVGIDLGLDGAVAVLEPDGQIMSAFLVPSIPAKTKRVKKKDGKVKTKTISKKQYDEPEMVRAIEMIIEAAGEFAPLFVLEKGQPLPPAMGGSQANFQRGLSFGLWIGILRAKWQRFEIVSPRSWQKVMFHDMRIEDTKQASELVAKRLWPKQDWRKSERCKKVHDGMTDAACIAEYGRRTF